jgi:hypothetical protein
MSTHLWVKSDRGSPPSHYRITSVIASSLVVIYIVSVVALNPNSFPLLFPSQLCPTSSLPRLMQPRSPPSALSLRMLSQKQTRVTRVSLDLKNPIRSVLMCLGPSRCSDGIGSCDPGPLHSVGICYRVKPLLFIHVLALDFSTPTQRVQSGSTAIALSFPTGMISFSLILRAMSNYRDFISSHA